MVLQSQLIGTLQRVDAGNKKLRQLTKMSFFTHMVVDNESIEESGHSWANYNNNRPKSNFFEAQTDRPNETTDHTSVEDGEGGKEMFHSIVTDVMPIILFRQKPCRFTNEKKISISFSIVQKSTYSDLF